MMCVKMGVKRILKNLHIFTLFSLFLKLFDKSEKKCYTISSEKIIREKLNIKLGGENEKTLLIITWANYVQILLLVVINKVFFVETLINNREGDRKVVLSLI